MKTERRTNNNPHITRITPPSSSSSSPIKPIMTSSSKRKSGLPILKFSSRNKDKGGGSTSNGQVTSRPLASRLLDTQKGGYSAIYTPVKKQLGIGKKAAATVVTPATTGTKSSVFTPPPQFDSRLSDLPPPPSCQPSATTTSHEEAVRVCVRIRPLSVDSDNHNSSSSYSGNESSRAWTASLRDENTIVKVQSTAAVQQQQQQQPPTYRFDQVYGEESTTQQIYDEAVSDIIDSVCNEGRNGTVFTYGQTNTGKTYTMHGILMAAGRDLFRHCKGGIDEDGFMRRVTFDDVAADMRSSVTTILVSCMELYNEELFDLLSEKAPLSSSLAIKEDRRGNVLIPNLTEWNVADMDELLNVIEIANEKKTTGSTAMNERSSRSHTIFRIRYEVKKEDGGVDKENPGISSRRKVVTTISTLNLVDLAGSESVRLTGAKGIRQKEGGRINQSLLTLSRVLEKLGNKEYSSGGGHINYRDSKLTRILKPSLSGNARMGAICCISPAVQYSEETKSTLDFATRTMFVTTNAKSNEVVQHSDAFAAEFEEEMNRMKMEKALAEERALQMEQSLQEAQDEITALKLQLKRGREAAESEIENNMWELMSMTSRNKELEENMQNTLRATELNKQAMELVRGQAKELEKENREFDVQVKELTRRNKQLEETNLDLRQNMQVTTTATVLNQQGMEVLTKQVKALEEQNEEYREEAEVLKIRNEGLMGINKDLKQDLQNSVNATTLHRQATESVRVQLKDLEKKNGSYVVQLGALNRRNKELNNNAEIKAETIAHLRHTISELNLQNQQLGQRLEMYTNDSRQSQESATEQKKSFEGKVHQMMGRIREEVQELSLSPKVSFD